MPKKYMPFIGLVVVLFLLGGVALAYTQLNKKPADQAQTETKKKKVSAPVNAIEVSQRPYVQVIPQASGRSILLKVTTLNKPADSVDYELEYQTESILQGAFGALDLKTVPVEKDILLGSCSAGGACTYHKDVQGGPLTLRFQGSEAYAVKSDWKYIENKKKDKQFSSRDAKFQVESADLAKVPVLIIYNTPGIPAGLSGTMVSNAYTLAAASSVTGKASVTLRLNEDTADAVIMGYDGQAWKEFKTTVNAKEAKAEVELMDLYVAVKK